MDNPQTRTLLHVGCGPNDIRNTTRGFQGGGWKEIRFDIDPGARPDVLGSMTDMSTVPDASVDAVYSSHNIEHVYRHEVPLVLRNFRRVLKPGGFALVICPDLRAVCELVMEDLLLEPAYHSPAGPVSPHDMLYGHNDEIAKGHLFMAHRCGFTEHTMRQALEEAGFASIITLAVDFSLWALAAPEPLPEGPILALARAHFPGVG